MDESPNDEHSEAGADEAGSTAEPGPARTRSRRRRRLWSTARLAGRITGPLLATVVAFAAVTSAAGTDRSAGSGATDLGGAQTITYREECEGEGCSNEEIRELWNSFQSECFQETCWTEEVFELAGGARYHQEPYHYETRMGAMFNAFRGRLGKWFQDPKMRMGPTEDFWAWFVQLIDGRVFKTPPIHCDPYCG